MATQKKKVEILAPPGSDAEAKKKALHTALAQIEKMHGDGAVMRLGDSAKMEVQSISTGSLSLDLAIGIGGIPREPKSEIIIEPWKGLASRML